MTEQNKPAGVGKKMVAAHVEPSVLQELKEVASQAGVTLAEVVALGIDMAIERHKKTGRYQQPWA